MLVPERWYPQQLNQTGTRNSHRYDETSVEFHWEVLAVLKPRLEEESAEQLQGLSSQMLQIASKWSIKKTTVTFGNSWNSSVCLEEQDWLYCFTCEVII